MFVSTKGCWCSRFEIFSNIFGSRLWFLTEVSDGRCDALRGYSKEIELGMIKYLDAHRYRCFSL